MRVLLLGAGFSRNWGGWLTSEVMGELCGRLADRPHLMEMLRLMPNFEDVLGLRRAAAQEGGNAQALEDVARLESAIVDMFRDMNMAFARRPDLEFCQDAERSIKKYLGRFDAIFTLNQDLLLDLHYEGMEVLHPERWTGFYLPGIVVTDVWRTAERQERVRVTMNVASELQIVDGLQPLVKLHGSVNWRTSGDDAVMVIGSGKERSIAGSTLLRWYRDMFREYLCCGDTWIMVIGYGFADPHINGVLLEAAEQHGMKMYLVNPAGLHAFQGHSGTTRSGRNELTKIPLMGMSTRSLTATFGEYDDPSLASFQRFVGV